MMRGKLYVGIFVGAYLLAQGIYAEPEDAQKGEEKEVAIVVNKKNPISDISLKDLQKVLRLEKKYWDNGKKIHFITQKAESWEHHAVLGKVYGMEHAELKTLWLRKMFRGQIASFPKVLNSNEAVKEFIANVPSGIGYIAVSSANETVKVLSIDGKKPGQPGYSLYVETKAGGK